MRGDHRRDDHEGEEADRELGALGGLELDRLPDDGVGRRADGRLLCRRAASETSDEIGSRTIEPSRSSPSSRSSATTTLASSRATSQRMRSPSGRSAAPVKLDDVERRRVVAQHAVGRLGERGRRDDAQVDHVTDRRTRA